MFAGGDFPVVAGGVAVGNGDRWWLFVDGGGVVIFIFTVAFFSFTVVIFCFLVLILLCSW